jgi:hypothetical protein
MGTREAKLADMASVRQTYDESVSDYFRRFKEIKNRCFNLTISEKILQIWPSKGCVLTLERNWRVIFICLLRNCGNLLRFKKTG